MMYLFLAAIFFTLWYIADKQLKARFNPYLKWGALAIIFIFVFYDTFMFIETERLLSATGGNDSNMCVSYMSNKPCTSILSSVVIGTLTSGDTNSLVEKDNNYNIIMLANSGTPYILDMNTTCLSDTLMFKGRSDIDQNLIEIYNGSSWITIYTFVNSTSDFIQSIDLATHQYIINNTMMFRVTSTSPNTSSALYTNIDQLDTNITNTYTMYCDDTLDTASIVIYHDTEYAIIPLIMGLLPDLAGIVAVLFGIQILMILYDNAMNPRGEADDVIGTDASSNEKLLRERDKAQQI